jgi:uncharacterized membrane protein YeaQ/YmgE (transglycosylase-associated protein family)
MTDQSQKNFDQNCDRNPPASSAKKAETPPIIKAKSDLLQTRKKISLVLLLSAFTGLIASSLLHQQVSGDWIEILIHGFEGALVGGLCDWFAVWKTFHAVQSNHNEVAAGIGQYIRKEILDTKSIKSKLEKILDDPLAMGRLRDFTNQYLSDAEAIGARLKSRWKNVHEEVYQWIAGLDLSQGDHNIIASILGDTVVKQTAKECVIAALKACKDKPEFDGLETVLKAKVSYIPDFVLPGFDSLFEMLEAKNTDPKLQKSLLSALGLFKNSYINTWNDLSRSKREQAVRQLVDPLADRCIEAASRFIASKAAQVNSVSTIRAYDPARAIVEFVYHEIHNDQLAIVANTVVN